MHKHWAVVWTPCSGHRNPQLSLCDGDDADDWEDDDNADA